MPEYVRDAGRALRALALRAVLRGMDLRARFPRFLTALGVLAIAMVVLALWSAAGHFISGGGPDPPVAIESADREAPFLVVCNECKSRVRMIEPPAQKLARERGLLRCPRCQRFAAAWYRRGGSVVPPGGW